MATICYKAIGMIFWLHEYALYLSVRRACRQAGEHHYLSDNSYNPPNNRSTNTISKIMGNFMGSVAEAEMCSTNINAKDDVHMQTYLISMGNPELPTKPQIENTTA